MSARRDGRTIRRLGILEPIVIKADGTMLAGHLRHAAAVLLEHRGSDGTWSKAPLHLTLPAGAVRSVVTTDDDAPKKCD